MIPNVIHFIFFNEDKNQKFLLMHHLSVLSAEKVHNPSEIIFHYHNEPEGEYWEKTKPLVTLNKVEVPKSFGKKKITKIAHKADHTRLEVLYHEGGVYMDLDTISHKSHEKLLDNKFVIGQQAPLKTLCNAIMFSEPKSEFLKIWRSAYEEHFDPNGWSEASLFLPYSLWATHHDLVKVVPKELFYVPTYNERAKIFEYGEISDDLITLHLWNNGQRNTWEDVDDRWLRDNPNALYTKLANKVYERSI